MIVNVDLMLKNVIEAEFKKSIKQHICKENYVWNPSYEKKTMFGMSERK